MKETLDPSNNVRKGIITKDKKELVDLQLNVESGAATELVLFFFFKKVALRNLCLF